MLLGGMTTDDILYTPLPLYHSAAGMLGVGAVILVGKLKQQLTTLDLSLIKHRRPICRNERIHFEVVSYLRSNSKELSKVIIEAVLKNLNN